MERSKTWRELLAEITRDPQERERIVRELNVNPITITRWINDESVPRIDNLRRLLNAVPDQRKHLFELLVRDFPDIALHVGNDGSFYEVTSDFYSTVFNTYVTTPASMRFWLISKMVLQYLLEQLDPDLHHAAVFLLQCQLSSGRIIRSMRSVMGVGTPPWGGNLETQTILLGAESFSGQVLLSGRPTLIENTNEYSGLWPASEYTFPGSQLSAFPKEMEKSSLSDPQIHRIASEMAAPVMRTDSRAGVLYVCSTLPGAFSSPHLQMLKECAMLVTLAFAPEDFYARYNIILHILPPPWMQGYLILQVAQRILQLMRETMNDEFPLDRVHAERIVWQQIEEELIQIASG
jgi:hypothetical protein